MDKLALIDGNSLLNRAFYATPAFTTASGMPTNAIFGFTKLLLKIIQDVKPQYLVVAFDMKAPTFRHKMFEGYKATRKGMPDELAAQVEPLKNLLAEMNIAICQQEGIEADDILGTLSNKFDVHSYIYTGDRDCYQLVDEKTDVYFTKRGVSDLLKLSIENFTEETGLKPLQIVDLKSLMGDKSDNIPGIAGIGEKTALDLIAKYQTLDGIYEHLDELKGALYQKFATGKESALLSYKLATIDRNCDLDVKLENCLVPQKFNGEVKRLFSEFEFKSLLSLDIFDKDAPEQIVEKQYPQKVICNDLAQLGSKLNGKTFSVAIDGQTAEFYVDGVEYSASVSYDLIAENALSYEQFTEVLRLAFENEKNRAIVYDYKTLLHNLDAFGVQAKCDFEDLSIIKYLVNSNFADNGLKNLCEQYGYEYGFCAYAINQLFDEFYGKLQTENLVKLYEEMEKPLIFVLYEMESTGVKVSLNGLDELSVQYRKLLDEIKGRIFSQCGKEFNLNSPMQLGEVLYGMGITEIKKKKTGKFTTGAEILEKISDKYPVVRDVLQYRLFQKLNSTYVDAFRPLLDKNGIIHTTFHQAATATGRLSSVNPNLQNIPIRKDEGRELRKIFVPRDGNIFIDADYSQIELRLLAHYSGCKELIEAYNKGVDIHAVTASQVFGLELENVNADMRRAAKAVNFGIIYGISDYGLSKDLNISVATAREYIERYFKTYSAVKEYMTANVEFAKKNGYVTTFAGRKRYIPEIKSSNYAVQQFGERAAMNMPLQGSSADIIKIAMIKVRDALKAEGLKTKIILQVHDELVLEAPQEEAEKAMQILKEQMETAVELSVPLTVDAHFGKTWYDAK